MGYGHASSVDEFLRTDDDNLIGKLASRVADIGIPDQSSAQIEAWRTEIQLLKRQLTGPKFKRWSIVLEYEIPRRSRRPDVILLSPGTIFVVEFKMGAQAYDAMSRWQANSYARDLRDFHAESHRRRIVPILCATGAHGGSALESYPFRSEAEVGDLVRTNGSNLGSWLLGCDQHRYSDSPAGAIAREQWLESEYRPTPTIIEAASRLYEGHGVREISHRYAHNLDETTEMLLREIKEARKRKHRVICFVTGVPGAGKTLTGLNVVHSAGPRRGRRFEAIFLSGNGPLVKIIQEALVLSEGNRGRKKGEARRKAGTFIQNVHSFLGHHFERPREPPFENVVVFDEAQRAWDQSQMQRKQGKDASEATLLLDVMERLPDWAVVIALVGGGQEIFNGEAGLSEWGNALENRSASWRVVASPEVLIGGESVAGKKLFEGAIPKNVTYHQEDLAHLDVVVRSHRAQRWAEWVNALLSSQYDSAQVLFPDGDEFPCVVTRDLDKARTWLRKYRSIDEEERSGLVATSKDHRLRAYGIERSSSLLTNFPFEKWFLSPSTDVRSSFQLEVAASEFECQGLELDWVGLCWGGDLTPSEGSAGWEYQKFRGDKWQQVRKEAEQEYTVNRYRVLLTRARKGLVIWVPKGDPNDPTREPERYDRVYDALRAAGVSLLEEE